MQNGSLQQIPKGRFSWLQEALFGSPDRTINVISLSCSATSLILTVLFALFPKATPVVIIARDLIFVSGLICVITVLAHRNVVKDGIIHSYQRYVYDQAAESRLIVNSYRNEVFKHFSEAQIGLVYDCREQDLKLIRHVCFSAMDSVRDALIKYFGFRGIPID